MPCVWAAGETRKQHREARASKETIRTDVGECMKFSLIMATVGRTREVERYLASLNAQTHRDFELIVVDQSGDDRLKPVLAPYMAEFPILPFTSELGASRARNVGLRHATGDVVAFPDDDCWYPPDLLARLARILNNRQDLEGITGRAVLMHVGCPAGASTQLGMQRFHKKAGLLKKTNVLRRATTYTIFVRRHVVEKVGGFDENMGPGAKTRWVAAEDADYILRVIDAGFKTYYSPKIYVYHPLPVLDYSVLLSRSYQYSTGTGYLWRKHNFPLWYVLYYLLRPAGRALICLLGGQRNKARYYLNSLRGRLRGLRSSQG